MSLQWIRVDDYEAMSAAGAARIAAAIEDRLRAHQPARVGLATGNTMLSLYRRLAEMLNRLGLDLSQLHTFNLDEYVGADGRWVPSDHPLSYHAYMEKNFFSRIDPRLGLDPSHVHFPDPASPEAIDRLICSLGGLDLQLLGIGFNGHIAFNEPIAESAISVEAFAALPTRLVDLTELTIETNARLTASGDRTKVPRQAVSMGMRPILAAREILLLACFPEQQKPLSRIKGGRPTPELPASYLLDHPQSTIIYTGDKICLGEGKRGQSPFVQSTLRAVPANGDCPLFPRGTLLIGYDVERIPGRVPGEKWVGQPLPDNTTEVFLREALKIHREVGVPATLFMVGCNIEKHVPALRACLDSGCFEIAQHTYEHFPLKTVLEESPDNVYLPGLPFDRIEEQLARPVELLEKHLGIRCRGITAPYTYYRGLADRPDILELVARHGMSYVRSYGRNSRDYFPLACDVQPFWYDRQGFPTILEIPLQGWIDAQWRREHGWQNWPAYYAYLQTRIDELAASGLCGSHCQHDWTSTLYDESLAWTRKFLEYAAERVEILTHFDFYQRMRRLQDEAASRQPSFGAATDARAGT